MDTNVHASGEYQEIKSQYEPGSLIQISDMRDWGLTSPEGLRFDLESTTREIPIRATFIIYQTEAMKSIIDEWVVTPARYDTCTMHTFA